MDTITYLYSALGLSYIVPFIFVLTIVVFFQCGDDACYN